MPSPETPAPFILANGELVPSDTPVIPANDGSIAFGQGIFETLAVYKGEVFALEPHLERLKAGAERLKLSIPSPEAISEQIGKISEANQLKIASLARLRITVTPSCVLLTSSTEVKHSESARAVTVSFARNEKGALSGFKTINYGENIAAKEIAKQAGADEAIFRNTRDELCEGSWSNIFVQMGGEWFTPPLNSGCLPGITRATILALNTKDLPKVSASAISMEDLNLVESAFLTSSIREIQPLSHIDGRSLLGVNCPDSQAFRAAYREKVRAVV